jgi:predicted PurR-regulated permease PerM
MNQSHLNKALGTIIVLLGLYVFFRYLLGWLLPFFIAFTIVSLLQPLIKAFAVKAKIKTELSAFLVVLAFYIILISTIGIGLFELLNQSTQMLLSFPEWVSQVVLPSLIDITQQAEIMLFRYPAPNVFRYFCTTLSTIGIF